jgi:hypothetical protein
MSPEEAQAKQIEIYRQMRGEERLKIALDLHTFACDMARRDSPTIPGCPE